jgi:hypothetical protein
MDRPIIFAVLACISAIGLISCQTSNTSHKLTASEQSAVDFSNLPETGTFKHTYHNHNWDSIDIDMGRYSILIDSPKGKTEGSDDNISFGFRPFVYFNKVTLQTKALLSRNNKSLSLSKWKEDFEQEPFGEAIYCKIISQLNEDQTYPVLASKLIKKMGLNKTYDSCNLNIKRPIEIDDEFEGNIFTNDLICAFSPKESTGKGPNLAVLYMPMEPIKNSPIPYQIEVPQKKAILCVDGQKVSLKKLASD